ncbi:MAG: cytochrome c [Rhodobacteraceae bacterium]|nr:cytochrome c [Paracoccaceae bacterium]
MKLIASAVVAAVIASAGIASAQEFKDQLKARQGQFNIIALNLGVLGGMARGNIDYDADRAQAAADSLAGIAMVDPAALWVEGSDNISIDGTRALPAIWDNFDDFASKWGAYVTAANAMQAAAGTGLEAIGPALGALGGTCGACHDLYRAPQ